MNISSMYSHILYNKINASHELKLSRITLFKPYSFIQGYRKHCSINQNLLSTSFIASTETCMYFHEIFKLWFIFSSLLPNWSHISQISLPLNLTRFCLAWLSAIQDSTQLYSTLSRTVPVLSFCKRFLILNTFILQVNIYCTTVLLGASQSPFTRKRNQRKNY